MEQWQREREGLQKEKGPWEAERRLVWKSRSEAAACKGQSISMRNWSSPQLGAGKQGMGALFNEEVRDAQLGMAPTLQTSANDPGVLEPNTRSQHGPSGAFWGPSSPASSGILGLSH